MFVVLCPGCQRKLRAPLDLSGKTIRCPRCQARVTVPTLPQPGNEESVTLPPPAPSATLSPPAGFGVTLPPTPAAPTEQPSTATVPGYEILSELGRGGMGVVYKARQVKLNRVVALKMILAGGHAAQDDLDRFRAEAEAVAQLQHPNIVQVFEVGEVGGLPFFSLEFVDGGSLDRHLNGTPLPPGEAAQLVETLARAMHVAHQKGIVHRDLKPANVLLAREGEAPAEPERRGSAGALPSRHVPKITDFGLAKKLDEAGHGRTRTGAVMGTPSYMAPEQASGQKIGPSADVYALGAILYECLTGRPPFRAPTALDTILQVLSDEPVPPSRLNPKVPRDLETIALHCLHKEPARRYASAAALGDDLRAFADDRPITARPVGRLTHAWRWCKRNRAVAALLALVFVALSAGAVTSTILGLKARASAVAAEENFRQADDNARQAEANARQAADGERRAVETLYATGINLAHREWQDSNLYRARQILDACPPRMRGWEWNFLDHLFRGELLRLHGHSGSVVDLAVSPSGDRIATLAGDQTTRLWDTHTGVDLHHLSPPAYRVTFSPDGRRLAGAVGQGAVQLWDADSGRPIAPPFPLGRRLCGLNFVDAGRRLAALSLVGEVVFVDSHTGEEVERCPKKLTLDPQTSTYINLGQYAVFSPDGRYVAQGGSEGKVRVWNAHTGEKVLEGAGHLMHVGQVAFSPDGKRLASPGGEGLILIWDLETKQTVQKLRGHRSYVHAVAFSPDGRRLVSGSKDLTACLWDLESGLCTMTLRGHVSEVWGVAFFPDGKRIVTRGADSRIKVWDAGNRMIHTDKVREYLGPGRAGRLWAGSGEAWTYFGHIGTGMGLALSDDGRFAATTAIEGEKWPGGVRLWDLDEHREVGALSVPTGPRHQPAFSPDGRLLAVGTSGSVTNAPGELRLFERKSGKLLHKWSGHLCATALPAFSPDGKHLACGFSPASGSGRLVVREVETGKEVFNREIGGMFVGPCYLGRDRLVITVAGAIWVLDARTGKELKTWQSGQSLLTAVAVSRGGLVATGDGLGAEARIRLWDSDTGRELRVLDGHIGIILSLAFSPDGSRLFSAASDFTVKVWHTTTRKELLSFREHRDVALQVAWSGDGRRLASIGRDGALKVWERGPDTGAPNTDNWRRLYRDDFGRDQLGEHWEARDGTNWSVRDGALRGALKMTQYAGLSFTYANAVLRGMDLPRSVEVRCGVEVSHPMLVQFQMHDPRREQSLVPMVQCLPRPFPWTGASVMLVNLAGGGFRPALLGTNRPYQLEAGKRHQFRIVRTPERLWMFIDDREVLAEEVPPMEAPELRLEGSWSDQPSGVEIAFTDLKVRAPTQAFRERQMRKLVEQHFDRLGARRAAALALERDKGLSAGDRAVTRRLLDEMREDPEGLLRTSLATSSKKEASAAEHRVALLQAEAARDLVLRGQAQIGTLPPRATLYLTAVGLARLRAGQPKEAQAELSRAVGLLRQQRGAATARQLAALALAAWQLGQKGEAQQLHQEALDLCHGAGGDELRVSEPWLDELKGLVPLAAADPERDAIFRAVVQTQAAGWQDRDLARFMAGRTRDYREEAGRTATPDQYDVVFDRTALARLRVWTFRAVPPGSLARYEKVRIDRDGDRATLRCEATVQIGDFFGTWGNEMRLKKEAEGWKIAFLRGWPVRSLAHGQPVTFDAAWWKARDAEAQRAAEGERPRALIEARHFDEALKLLRQRTARPGATAQEWTLRGHAALQAGQADEAHTSFLRAEQLDPETELHRFLNGPLQEMGLPKGVVYSVAYLPSGELLTGGSDGVLRRWGADGKLSAQSTQQGGQILTIAVTPDGKRAASASTQLCFWDPATLKAAPTKSGHARAIYRIAFNHDGSRLVSASADQTARVWDGLSAQPLVELKGHGAAVLGAVFSPDGKWVATASHDRTARLWDAVTGKLVRTFSGHKGEVIRVVFSPDGKQIATAGAAGEVKLWSVETGKELHALKAGDRLVEVVAFSPDGRLLAAAGEGGEVRLWNTRTLRLVRVLRGHRTRVYSLAFSADGKRLAAGAGEPVIRVWEVPTAE
jgi:WD40 repeat protein